MNLDATIRSFSGKWAGALLQVDSLAAARIGDDAIAALGLDVFADRILVPTLDEMGARWETGQASLAEVYIAGRIANAVLAKHAVPRDMSARDAPVAVASLDDYHVLGKNLVLAALRAAGLPVCDLGTQDARSLADMARDEGFGLVLVSTLMLRSALHVQDLVRFLKLDGTPTRVIVGGAPFRIDPELWSHVGADGMGTNAAAAVAITRSWLEEAHVAAR